MWAPFAESHLPPIGTLFGRNGERGRDCTTEMWVLLRNLVTFQLQNHHVFFSHGTPVLLPALVFYLSSALATFRLLFFFSHLNKNAFRPTAQPTSHYKSLPLRCSNTAHTHARSLLMYLRTIFVFHCVYPRFLLWFFPGSRRLCDTFFFANRILFSHFSI